MLPVRPGIVPANRLALGQQRRDRLAEGPGGLAVGAGLALVDLRALGVDAEHDCLAGRGDSVGERVGGECGRAGQHENCKRKTLECRHGASSGKSLVIARSSCDEAIQYLSAETVWIASLRSQ